MGRIIMCYAGVGKTTLAKKNKNYIDLDSCFFSGKSVNYALLTLRLAGMGHDVLVSAHKELYDNLVYYGKMVPDLELITVYPSIVLKEAWSKKLMDRYLVSKSEADKAALLRVINCYDADLEAIGQREGKKIVINDINAYDLGLLLADTPEMAYRAIKNEEPRDGDSFWWKGEQYTYLDDEWMDEERFNACMQLML